MSDVAELYQPLIERDLDAIPAAVDAFRASHTSDDLFLAVARFAILAHAPSLHSKHAVLAALSAHQLRETMASRWDDLLAECARYCAESRQPWSEPPILEPPRIERDQRSDAGALREAVAARDRLAGERWLAARLGDDEIARDLLTVAADDFDDLGVKFIVAAAALKLSSILGERGRYAALRVAVWELTASPGNRYVEKGHETNELRPRLIARALAEHGSLESVHAVFLYDAAVDTVAFPRVCDYLASSRQQSSARELPPATASPVYRLARDYGQYLRACAGGDERLKSAAAYNLEHASSFADWSFA